MRRDDISGRTLSVNLQLAWFEGVTTSGVAGDMLSCSADGAAGTSPCCGMVRHRRGPTGRAFPAGDSCHVDAEEIRGIVPLCATSVGGDSGSGLCLHSNHVRVRRSRAAAEPKP